MHVAVVGAGAFGGWAALHLLRRGVRVTLLDAWGAANSRSSSGGETRVVRGSYGPRGIYTEMVARSLPMWRENQTRWGRRLFFENGALWIASESDAWERASVEELRRVGLAVEILGLRELQTRYTQMNWEGLKWAILEKEAGYMLSRRACQSVVEGFLAEGGEYRELTARPGEIASGEMRRITLSDGAELEADQYLFACGAWLSKLFPEEIGTLITPTRQEVFFFGVPAGLGGYTEAELPTWVDNSPRRYYGIPGNDHRGFKIADDTPKEPFDPSHGDRTPSAEGIEDIRRYLSYRFPALKRAPLLETRVCQYEMTPDGNFILDRHPRAQNVWFMGGGSGHGFKVAPAAGELAADLVTGARSVPGLFQLARFSEADRLVTTRPRA